MDLITIDKQAYCLSTVAGVKRLLRDRPYIQARRYKGDTTASDILIDLESAMMEAQMTNRQLESIAWIYGMDVTQQEAAKMMGVTQQAIATSIDSAVERIVAVYKRWQYGMVTVKRRDKERGGG